MVFVESPIFTRIISELMDDEGYRDLQDSLIQNPEVGDVIPGGGGLRKMRWRVAGRGKRGGSRVIYYWVAANDELRMLYAYRKNAQENLSKDQLKTLRRIIERW